MFQTASHCAFQLLAQTAHVRAHSRKWVHTRPSEKNRTQRLTRRNRGLPSLDHSAALRCLRNHSNQLHLQPLIPPCFYIHTFPGSLWPPTISNSSISDHLSSRFSTSRTNGPRLLSQAKAGTHSAFGERSHTRAHTAKQVAFWVGVVSLPSERFTRFGNPAWPGIRTANFAAFGSWPGVRQKDAESLRDSDALMRVAVPRRRGPAGLRGLFRFCRSCGLYALFQILLSILQTFQLVLFL